MHLKNSIESRIGKGILNQPISILLKKLSKVVKAENYFSYLIRLKLDGSFVPEILAA